MIAGALGTDDPIWLAVEDISAVGAVRRTAAALGEEAGLPPEALADLALVSSEIATNLARHARDGVISMRITRHDDPAGVRRAGVQLVSVDSGPGIADIEQATVDGHSTGGTLGIGLGAIKRKATELDMYSKPGSGTVIVATLWSPPDPVERWAAAIARPMPGEAVCGDAFAGREAGGRRQIMLCDGLGHGLLAAASAQAARAEFLAAPWTGPRLVLHHIHDQIRHTRGVVAGVAELGPEPGLVRFAGIGNISAALVADGRRRLMVSLPGIVGGARWETREFEYRASSPGLVVLHSDGLSARWDIGDYPGLATHGPLVIAAILLRDAGRRRDDAAVLVARTS